jgi:hypothetical protein
MIEYFPVADRRGHLLGPLGIAGAVPKVSHHTVIHHNDSSTSP